ncbi:hypothetical protein GYO_3642 [Bacillus spizizenii TU-B-10]|uniref:Uncharacterized protein n=1 Tax=Bacillus spizizenii (strain DSM 15029 / JCM 12233 / NBRC 101239 / NRRL B-23049 / TU-B-10) TaxID=1052585 RepID=G4P0N9_BACS4|nr:hypothetical protein GYO_3642 [Bacillus spizizenii TU-B-10]
MIKRFSDIEPVKKTDRDDYAAKYELRKKISDMVQNEPLLLMDGKRAAGRRLFCLFC